MGSLVINTLHNHC